MTDRTHDTDLPPRRGFMRRVAGAASLGLSSLGLASLGLAGLVTSPASAQAVAPAGGPDWPGTLRGRHRQMVDAYEANGGAPLEFVYTFLATNDALGHATVATAVVVLRHAAFPIALGNEIWRKYKIGEAFKILDPETKAPAVKNPFLRPKPGVLPVDDMAVDRLLALGVVLGACNVALQGESKMLAGNAGVSASEAAKEWAANVIQGITILPSGVWGVNRAQEVGCTYCSGG